MAGNLAAKCDKCWLIRAHSGILHIVKEFKSGGNYTKDQSQRGNTSLEI